MDVEFVCDEEWMAIEAAMERVSKSPKNSLQASPASLAPVRTTVERPVSAPSFAVPSPGPSAARPSSVPPSPRTPSAQQAQAPKKLDHQV
jgi:hypothetical protein